jgi:hypothetical protein
MASGKQWWAGGKPLSTRSSRSIFPVVFVDTSPRSGEPQKPVKLEKQSDPVCGNPDDQSLVAAAQWGSGDKMDDTWLRSWYYPTDAFDPWPSHTDLRCWYCTHPFDNTPFPLPWSYNPKQGKWRVRGLFCGPSCSKAYALERDIAAKCSVMVWINEIARKFYGYTFKSADIPVAPRRELLREYCGPKGLTIQQYRSACLHGRSITLHRPGFITIKQVVEAEQKTVKQYRGVAHKENPDRMISTRDLTQAKRMVFGGKGARRIAEFLK